MLEYGETMNEINKALSNSLKYNSHLNESSENGKRTANYIILVVFESGKSEFIEINNVNIDEKGLVDDPRITEFWGESYKFFVDNYRRRGIIQESGPAKYARVFATIGYSDTNPISTIKQELLTAANKYYNHIKRVSKNEMRKAEKMVEKATVNVELANNALAKLSKL